MFNSKIEDHNSFVLDCVKRGEHALAQKSSKIRKRQKCIKQQTKVTLGYNSEDEKRIRKAQEKAYRKKRQMANSAKKPRIYGATSTATVTRSNDDRQRSRGNASDSPALSLVFPSLFNLKEGTQLVFTVVILLSLFI